MQWDTPQHKGINDYEDTNTGLAGDPHELYLTFLDIADEAEKAGRHEDAANYRKDAEQARKLRDGEL